MILRRTNFAKSNSNGKGPGSGSSGSDPGFDIIDDFELIIPSFQQQYGLRLRDELDRMTFDEFLFFLYALNDETPLGKLVEVRLEKDPDRLKQFTPEMNRIRTEWLTKQAKKISKEELQNIQTQFRDVFLKLGKVVEKHTEVNDHAEQ